MIRWLAVLAVAILPFSAPAHAEDPLSSAKRAGLVGEKPDGLAGVVAGPPEIAILVERINAQRLERYRRIARENGTSLDAVRKLAGERLVKAVPDGQYVMSPSGRWVKK